MSYQFTTLCTFRFISGIFALLLAGFLWKHRHTKGVLYLLLFEIAAAVWAIGDGFESAALTVETKMHWAQFAYLGISTCAAMFLMFATSYANLARYSGRRILLLLLIVPLITMTVALTNPLTKLLWTNIEIRAGTTQSIYFYGPYFWFNVFYQYVILFLGIIVLLFASQKVYSPYKAQFIIIVVGALFPFLASISYVFKLFPLKGFDPTPVSFILSGFIVALGIFWFRMFNIMPLARKEAIDNLRDGMIVVDSGNLIVEANKSFFSITGLSPRQVTGKATDSVFSEISIDIVKLTSENDFTMEAALGKDYEEQTIEVKYQPITDETGKYLGGIYTLSNITLKKMILDAIADSNKSRKIELVEKEKLILDLDAYARSVAHDLKNPIGSVVSLAELIKIRLSENDLSDVGEMIDHVHNQSRKMVGIIDGLLLLSRIRKEDIVQTHIDTGRILATVLNRLENEISGFRAIIDMPDLWPEAMGHQQWIEEVWVNLISNAIKYGGKPPVIKLGYDRSSEKSVRFWISDNGNGLPAEALGKIFNDFERMGVKDSLGFGLGLPIVKRIVEKLGGELLAESAFLPGEGCRFSFTLRSGT